MKPTHPPRHLALQCARGIAPAWLWAWVTACLVGWLFGCHARLCAGRQPCKPRRRICENAVQRRNEHCASRRSKPRRVQVELGQLDPRPKLAPVTASRCPPVPSFGAQPCWFALRAGRHPLECFWPVTVKVYGQALVAVVPLRPGLWSMPLICVWPRSIGCQPITSHRESDRHRGPRRGAQTSSPVKAFVREDIKLRRWFAAGDPVRVVVRALVSRFHLEGTA